ncbi:ArnT family glycosyltransferase [Streptomyces sp. NPDC102467]|uniref:ArnT family glycosyltransferase n=1 Tax=Streptomyces sp. NPDC102467 TaxID=3366179 RepID=UPI0037FC2902
MGEDAARAEQVGAGLAPVAWRPLLVVAAAYAGILTLLSPRYGYHRDELYFVAAGRRLDWGYVDQPPLTPVPARASTAFFRDSLVGLRVSATLAAAATVVVVVLVARELGGRRGAQLLAAVLAGLGAQVLAVGHMVSTATFDLLVWVTVSWLVLRVLRTGDGRWWLAVGAVTGVGVQNKYLVVLLVIVLLVVLLAAGCEPTLRWARAGSGRRALFVGAVLVSAALNAMITLPVLPPSALSVPMALNKEQGEQLGRPELADAARRGWARIPTGDRARSVILTGNYGEAGALERYGPARGIPAPDSGHMSYADWGPPPDPADGPVLLVRQTDASGIERYFTGCRTVAHVDNGQDVSNEEQGAAIVLCAGPAHTWSLLWPSLRHTY